MQSADVQALQAEILAGEHTDAGGDLGDLMTLAELQARFDAATDVDALDEAYNDVSLLPLPDREKATAAYTLRRDALELP